MTVIWCPVSLISDDCELLDLVQNHCRALGITDLHAIAALNEDRIQQAATQDAALAQILLLDVNGGASVVQAEESISFALKRNPRDVVIGIGGGFRGSTVADWARRGMHGFIDSPIDAHEFTSAMLEANAQCLKLRMEQSELRMLSMRRQSITQREEEVLELVVQGVPNKNIAHKLDVSQRTIESRRQKIYQKMNAKRLADLIRALDKLEFLSRTLNQFA